MDYWAYFDYNNAINTQGAFMGNRLSKIYTRTGDDGTTAVADGTRLPKSDLRFDAMGAVDLLNSQIGMLIAIAQNANITQQLSLIQHLLFNIGGHLAMPSYLGITAVHVQFLERQIDLYNEDLPYLKEFILPAGSTAIAQTHLVRCHSRDAERCLIKLHAQDGNIDRQVLAFINRLSDYFFVLSRVIARCDGGSEVLWDKQVLDKCFE